MWFLFSLITFLAWGAADLFYKKGAGEKYSHLKTAITVGLVMGATAIITLLTRNLNYDFRNLLVYLPVSLMYILSMTVGYLGLRYLELSVSSPIQNASGAVSALMLMIVLKRLPDTWTRIAILLITAGVILLGVWERQETVNNLDAGDHRYRRSATAILFPVGYCVLDSLGTFFDGWYLDDVATTPLLGITEDTIEDVANVSYQLTFLAVALLLMFYLHVIRREPLRFSGNGNRFLAALLESGGQISYVYALSGNGIAAAPVIGSYCVASVCLARIFLKEKLSKRKYAAIGLVIAGIILMGIIEGVSGVE